MNITRTPSPHGLRSILTYWYQGIRYRPTLGCDLTADQERREALVQIQRIHDLVHRAPAVDGMTFQAFVPTYLKRMRIKGRTGIHRNQKIIEQHLVPFFGAMRIRDIRLAHGENYIEQRQHHIDVAGNRTVADGTIERECSVLSAIINLAVEHEHVERNRLRTMPVPTGSKRERVASPEELGLLLGRASDPLRRAIVVAINTGLRQNRVWAIEQAWIKPADDGPWLHLPDAMTKTKGNPRRVPINRLAADALTIGIRHIEPRRIFCNWSRQDSLKHEFHKLCVRCRIEGLTFHDLRHTFATALKGLGVDFEMREILLGHKLPGIVDHYSHDTPQYDTRLRMALTTLAQHWDTTTATGATPGATSENASKSSTRKSAKY